MARYADLEIGLLDLGDETGKYTVQIRFSDLSDPSRESAMRVGPEEGLTAAFDFSRLTSLTHRAQDYGEVLTSSLFHDDAVRSKVVTAMALANENGLPLRLRLVIRDALLQGLHWETLLHPEDKEIRLAVSDNIRFSRYPESPMFERIGLRAKGELRALVAIANPNALETFQLSPVDVAAELERARRALGEIEVIALPDDDRPASLKAIVGELGSREYDIVYLVCHGAIQDGVPWLMLDPDDEETPPVQGSRLVSGMKQLSFRPRFVVLASCESASAGTGGALTALGPQLSTAGVPAVLAMQGRIEMETIVAFMPVLFTELIEDGEIDRAVAKARREVASRPDHWMPALFMRISSGRIWYVPGFSQGADDFQKWRSLVTQIRQDMCLPIVGPGLSDRAIASRSETAGRWANAYAYPRRDPEREQIHRVAQYVATTQGAGILLPEHRLALRAALLERYADTIAADLRNEENWSVEQLQAALESAISAYITTQPENPYRQLARLEQPIYIVTSPYDLMSSALRAEGRPPVVRVCKWNDRIPDPEAVFEGKPTAEVPLVYHLYGRLSVPDSVVYSEDDYFDYLIGMTRNRDLIPSDVVARLADSSLLFLGFRLDDPEFRVIFRFIMTQEGREGLRRVTHVAAQLEPSDFMVEDHQRAQDYLEEYFSRENIDTYWGTAEEFLGSLSSHLAD